MAAMRKSKHSVAMVKNRKTGRIVCYLSERDIEQGSDIAYDMAGYEVISL